MIKYDEIKDIDNFLLRFGLILNVATGGACRVKEGSKERSFVRKEHEDVWTFWNSGAKVPILNSNVFLNTIKNTEKKTNVRLFE
jgi:hypothetical protein